MNNRRMFLMILLLLTSSVSIGCNAVAASTVKSSVVITSPPSNSQFHEGEQVMVQSTSNDLAGVAQVELLVDGVVVRTDLSPQSQVNFTVVQPWTATVGLHTLMVRAINTANGTSEPAAVSVLVLSNLAAQTPTPTATPTASARACLNSAFVSDVTVPDGTALAPGQTFNKIWRVRNTGTCTWDANDQFVFLTGEAMTPSTVLAVPVTSPGSTVDLLVTMVSPQSPGTHTSQWRLKNRTNGYFGATYNVTLSVLSPTPISCTFTPSIDSFTASATTIAPGQSTTLSWGLVRNAQIAEIDNGIGGVATPGSMVVNPTTTTTYTLTGTCGSKVTQAQVTINVVGATATPVPPTPTATHTPAATPTPTATP